MKPLYLDAVGVAAPGLADWPQTQAVLLGEQPYRAGELSTYAPTLLPANERRRATPAVRLAFRVAEEAVNAAQCSGAELAGVFASSEADTTILDRICRTLAQPAPALSPTDFHNSVHNAAAGYWSIATGATLPSVTLAAYDASFSAALLEAFTLALAEQYRVLMVCYDIRPPEPLYACRPLAVSAGVAMVLSPQRSASSIATLTLAPVGSDSVESRMQDTPLETLRLANPATRALPLLQCLARRQAGDCVLAGNDGQYWSVQVQPL